MTTDATKLARECGIRIHKHSDDECHMISTNLLTRFYAKAQAAALREAAGKFPLAAYEASRICRRMADEKEKKA